MTKGITGACAQHQHNNSSNEQ